MSYFSEMFILCNRKETFYLKISAAQFSENWVYLTSVFENLTLKAE